MLSVKLLVKILLRFEVICFNTDDKGISPL